MWHVGIEPCILPSWSLRIKYTLVLWNKLEHPAGCTSQQKLHQSVGSTDLDHRNTSAPVKVVPFHPLWIYTVMCSAAQNTNIQRSRMWAQKLANIRYTEVKKKLLEILSLYSSFLLAFSAGDAIFKGCLCHFSDTHTALLQRNTRHIPRNYLLLLRQLR